MKCSLKLQDDDKLSFNYFSSDSIWINCCEFYSFCKLKDGKILAEVRESVFVDAQRAALLLMHNWVVINQLELPYRLNIGHHLLLPGFDFDTFPFIIDYGTGLDSNNRPTHNSDSYNIINLKTGHKDVLI